MVFKIIAIVYFEELKKQINENLLQSLGNSYYFNH